MLTSSDFGWVVHTKTKLFDRYCCSCESDLCGECRYSLARSARVPKKVRLAFFLVLVVLGGCQGPHFDLDRHASPPTGQINPIHGGSTADEPHHDATVSIHYSSSSSIFCSGTLIAPDVVLTAAHCVSSGGSYRVYFGDNPVQDPSPRFVTVSEVQRHPEYSSAALTSDIALVRLAEAVNDIAPVPPLPESLGLTQADLGVLPVNFAGFGRTENGTFDQKLQVDGTVEALGCDVSGCSGTPTALEIATQFSYTQPAGGPCNGDSGGPAFVERGDDIYVAGITSYGGACSGGTGWGASTRVDAFESFIAEFVGDPVDPVDPVPTETVTLTEEGLSGEQTEELRFEFEIPEDATAIPVFDRWRRRRRRPVRCSRLRGDHIKLRLPTVHRRQHRVVRV